MNLRDSYELDITADSLGDALDKIESRSSPVKHRNGSSPSMCNGPPTDLPKILPFSGTETGSP